MLKCVELAKQLVSIPSFDNNKQVSLYLKEYLEKNGVTVKAIESKNVVNLISRIGNGKPSLLLNAHTDTVPPQIGAEMQKAVVKGGKLTGLGAVDMKSGVAAMTTAFLELAKCQDELNGQVTLVLVGDEEKGGADGTNATVAKGVIADYVVIGEPTNLKVCLGQKSALQFELSSNGVARHSSRIQPGDNAVTKVVSAVSRLEKAFPTPIGSDEVVFNQTTMNVGTIFGGTAVNVVPSRCVALVDFRFSPGIDLEDMREKIRKNLNGSVTVNEKFNALGWSLDRESQLCKASISAMKQVGVKDEFVYKFGSNDARFYKAKGCEVVNIGPGNNLLSHTGKEEIEATQIDEATNIYVNLAKQLLK